MRRVEYHKAWDKSRQEIYDLGFVMVAGPEFGEREAKKVGVGHKLDLKHRPAFYIRSISTWRRIGKALACLLEFIQSLVVLRQTPRLIPLAFSEVQISKFYPIPQYSSQRDITRRL